MDFKLEQFINTTDSSVLKFIFKPISELLPWQIVTNLEAIIQQALPKLDPEEYFIDQQQAIHKTAMIEPTAQLKGSMIIGPNCFIANGSLVRGGAILDAACTIGHCSELKTTILFAGSKLAHLNFVGDSLLGVDVNIEGGAIIANYRNEWVNKEIKVCYQNQYITTGVLKFGALVGDHSRIGANAVIAPGAILNPNTIIKRGEALDQLEGDLF